MSALLEKMTQDIVRLSPDERLSLAGLILEMDVPRSDPATDQAWENEIRARIEAVDSGAEKGVPYEEVMLAAARLLKP